MPVRPRRRPRDGVAAFLLLCLGLLTALAVTVPFAALAAPPDFALLRMLRETGRQEEALAEVRRALRVRPENPDLLLFEARILTDLGRYDRADAVLARAIRIAPAYRDLRLARARALFFAGRHDRALAVLAALLDPDAGDARAWLLAARIHFAAGDLDRAEAAVVRLRELAPENPDGLLTAADLAHRRGRLELAAAGYEKLLRVPGYETLVRRRLEGLAAERRRFRLTVAGSLGAHDDKDRAPWRDGSLELAWRWDRRSWLRGRLEVRNRFGETDVGILLAIERRLGEATTLELGLGGTPGADFSPRFEMLLGLAHRLRRGAETFGDTVGSGRLRVRRYPRGRVRTLELGLTQYFLEARLRVTTAIVHTADEAGGRDLGLAARVDGVPAPGWRLFAGTTIERDELERGTTLARSLSAGIAVDLDERLRLFLDFGITDRDAGGLRRTVGLGLTVAF